MFPGVYRLFQVPPHYSRSLKAVLRFLQVIPDASRYFPGFSRSLQIEGVAGPHGCQVISKCILHSCECNRRWSVVSWFQYQNPPLCSVGLMGCSGSGWNPSSFLISEPLTVLKLHPETSQLLVCMRVGLGLWTGILGLAGPQPKVSNWSVILDHCSQSQTTMWPSSRWLAQKP